MRRDGSCRVEPGERFWCEPTTIEALRDRDIGRLFRLLSITSGASQTRIGIDTNLSQGQVSQIIGGRRKVTQFDVIERIAAGLRMPDAARVALGLAPREDPCAGRITRPEGHDAGVKRREFLRNTLTTGAAVAGAAALTAADVDRDSSPAGRHPDRTTAGHLAALVHILRQEDDVAPTGSLLPMSRQLLGLAEHWIAHAKVRDRPEIGRAAAEAALLLWWLNVDAGRAATAAGDRAIALAVEWDIPAIIGHMFGWRAGLAMGNGDLTAAVQLARRAREPRWALSPGAIGWSSIYEARAHALLGDPEGLTQALDVSQAAHEDVNLSSEPPWMYWLGDMLELNKLDLRLLREGPDAAPDINAELAQYPADRDRDVAWYRAHVASARAWAGDIGGAARDAEEAGRLSAATGTNWTMGELHQIAAAPHLHQLRDALADSGPRRST
jgi:hypothetical protein